MWIKQFHEPPPPPTGPKIGQKNGGIFTIPQWVVYDIVFPTLYGIIHDQPNSDDMWLAWNNCYINQITIDHDCFSYTISTKFITSWNKHLI